MTLLLLALPVAAQGNDMQQDDMGKSDEMGAMDEGQDMEMSGEMGEMEMSPEQMAMMEAWQKAGTPGEEHAALAELAGDYTLEVKSWMDPNGEPTVSAGTSHSEMILGGRVLKETVHGEMMGMPFEGIGMTGYDNTKGAYWSTWVDSMSTGIGVAEGNWNDDHSALVMHMDFVDPMSHETKTVRTVSTHKADGSTVFEWYEPMEGNEVKTMEIVYTPKM